MKYAYWVVAVLSCALAATYYGEGKVLLTVLWGMSGVVHGFLAAMHY